MPILFSNKYYHELPDKLTLLDIERNEFEFVIIKDIQKIFLGGWKQLAAFYDLQLGGYIRMVYLCRGLFFIQVFNTFGDEVFAPHVHVPGHVHPHGPLPAIEHPALPPTALSLRHTPVSTSFQQHIPPIGPSNQYGTFNASPYNIPQNIEGLGENFVNAATSSVVRDDRTFYLLYSKELNWKDVTQNTLVRTLNFFHLYGR